MLKNLLYVLEATFSVRYALNFVRMFALIKSWTSLKMCHFGSKTRSLGQILEKPCVHARGHIFSPILVKLGQTFCLDESWTSLEMGDVWSKTKSLGQFF